MNATQDLIAIDSEPAICRGGSGHFLPLFGDAEQTLPDALRAVMYMAGLLYCFLGVSIAADLFIVGIERITSQTRKVTDSCGQTKRVRVWNETVANLTLMALGSSAPEILLNVIEVTGDGFYSGALGPSAVVGSAAFNLLAILGVCMLAVPDGQIRRVKDFGAATLLAFSSVFAYLWLVVVVSLNTIDVIDVWEGVTTFLFFPLLVTIAWAVDTGKLSCGQKERELAAPPGKAVLSCEIVRERSAQSQQSTIIVQQHSGSTLQQEISAFSMHTVVEESLSWSQARSDALRAMSGSRRVSSSTSPVQQNCGSAAASSSTSEGESLTYREQVCEALFCNGCQSAQQEATWAEFILHLVALPWKLPLAVLTPPAAVAGGWLCFAGALLHIGVITTLIGDLAELFGCVVGLEDSITALTFVAMGTSMPELFASKAATVKNSWADASITNITGSNSINVFLGMGLPWMFASIFWNLTGATDEWMSTYSTHQAILEQYPDGAFVVLHGDLTFGVTVFVVAAAICFCLLVMRRWKFGGELGGPTHEVKVLSSVLLITLWLLYVSVSVWEISTKNQDVFEQFIAVLLAGAVLVLVMLLTWGALYCTAKARKDPEPQQRHHSEAAVQRPGDAGTAASNCEILPAERLADSKGQLDDPDLEAKEGPLADDGYVREISI